jgi:hypothetical protein
MTDSSNCGICGKVCSVVNGAGGCEDGTCLPALSECIPTQDPPLSCDDVCAAEGKVCVEQGCNMSTFLWYGDIGLCEDFSGTPNAAPCAYPMVDSNDYYRCCCQG